MSDRPAKKGNKHGGNSFESKGSRVIAPEVEKITVNLEIAPDYIVRAIFPKPRRTLQEILEGREVSDLRHEMQPKKMSATERSRRLKDIDEKMKQGR